MKPSSLGKPIKVWYKALPLAPKILWPILEVRFSLDGKSLPQAILSLVDSGASISILRPDVAEILGFAQKQLGVPQRGTSVSGVYRSWKIPKPIEVNIYGHMFSFHFEVIDNPGLVWPCILGGDSIFQVSRIDFLKFKGYFELKFRQDLY